VQDTPLVAFRLLLPLTLSFTDGRFASAQTALMLQEETIRRNERERKLMSEKLSNLERSLSGSESEKRQLQERNAKLKAVSYYSLEPFLTVFFLFCCCSQPLGCPKLEV